MEMLTSLGHILYLLPTSYVLLYCQLSYAIVLHKFTLKTTIKILFSHNLMEIGTY